MMRAKKIILLLGFSAIPAIFAASTAIYGLIYDNSQGEAFDTLTGIYRYDYLLKIFCIIFGVIFFTMFLAISAILLGIFLIEKFNEGRIR